MDTFLMMVQDTIWRRELRQALSEYGYQAVQAGAIEDVVQQVQKQSIRLVLADARALPSSESARELVATCAQKCGGILLLVRSYDDMEKAQQAAQAWKLGVQTVIGPFTTDSLISQIRLMPDLRRDQTLPGERSGDEL